MDAHGRPTKPALAGPRQRHLTARAGTDTTFENRVRPREQTGQRNAHGPGCSAPCPFLTLGMWGHAERLEHLMPPGYEKQPQVAAKMYHTTETPIMSWLPGDKQTPCKSVLVPYPRCIDAPSPWSYPPTRLVVHPLGMVRMPGYTFLDLQRNTAELYPTPLPPGTSSSFATTYSLEMAFA